MCALHSGYCGKTVIEIITHLLCNQICTRVDLVKKNEAQDIDMVLKRLCLVCVCCSD